MPTLLRVGLLSFSLLLAGCATQPDQQNAQQSWAEHSQRLQQLIHWRATGKMALRSAEQAETATLIWIQHGGVSHLNLSGPLGVGTTIIQADSHNLEIQRGGETQTYDISSPAAMLENTGWDLPLQALPHWLKGLSAPALEIQSQVVEQGLLRRLEQQGWTVTFETYQLFDHHMLPTRLRLEHQQTRVRFIIRDWKILAS